MLKFIGIVITTATIEMCHSHTPLTRSRLKVFLSHHFSDLTTGIRIVNGASVRFGGP